MRIYVINIALIIYWWLLYALVNSATMKKRLNYKTYLIVGKPIKKSNIIKGILLSLPFIQIYLMISLKNYSVGTDTAAYLTGFNMILDTSWQDIFNFQIHNLVFNFERGFILASKFISIFTEDFTAYSAIIYAVMIFPLYHFIKKQSVMPFLSLILFITFGFLNFYFSGMRQAIAISIVLLSYDFIVNRKMWRFFCAITIALLFHQSAIFFLPAYFMTSLTLTPIIGISYSLFLAIIYAFRFRILEIVTQYIYTGSTIVDTGAYTLLLIVSATFMAGLLFYKKVIAMNPNNKLIYNLIGVAVGLMIFTTASNITLRAANYYYIFMILFIPNVIVSIRDRTIRNIALSVVVVFTLTYYFKIGVNVLNGNPYTFFWQ